MNNEVYVETAMSSPANSPAHLKRLARPDIYMRPTRQNQIPPRSNRLETKQFEPVMLPEPKMPLDVRASNKIIQIAGFIIHVASNFGSDRRTA